MTAGPTTNSRLVPIIPDGGWGWVVVIGSFFIHVFADGFVYSFGVMVNVLMQEFNSDNTMASLIISLLTGLTLGSGPLASAVCNKYGCRMTVIIGACIAFVGCTIASFATSMWHIVFSVGVIMGVGFGLMYCPAIVIVTMYFERRRSLATGVAVAGAGVGTVVFSPINDFIITNFGWRAVFHSFLGILVLCVVCGWTFRPLAFREANEDEDSNVTYSAKKSKGAKPEEIAALLKNEKRSKPQEAVKLAKSLTNVTTTDEEQALERRRSGTVGERSVGYLNKKDVFYTGSITNVAEFAEHPDRYRSTGSLHKRSMSLNSGGSEKLADVKEGSEENSQNSAPDAEGGNMLKTISNMLSLSLLVDPTFLIFAISNLLTSVGFNSPLYFLPLHAERGVGLDSASSSRVLSAFGLFNTLGRVVFGVVADHKLPLPYGLGTDLARNRLWMYNISLAICGVLTAFCYLFNGFISLSIYAGMFGFSIASYICLTSVILVDLLGLDKLTNAFGLLLLWQGVGTVFGPPIAGYLADMTNTYAWSFVFCGVNLLISGLMLFAIPFFQRKRAGKKALPQELSSGRKQMDVKV